MGFVGSVLGAGKGAGYQALGSGNEGQLQPLFNQAQQLSNMYMQQAQGNGPSVAADQLQQATNANIANASGMISSQKGLNPALAARLASQQATNAGQQAAGQSGVLRAQEQLAGQSGLANLNQSQQSIIQGGINSQNSANSGVATQNAKGQFGLLNGAGMATGLFAEGGMVSANPLMIHAANPIVTDPTTPQSFVARFAENMNNVGSFRPADESSDAMQRSKVSSKPQFTAEQAIKSAPIGGEGATDLGLGSPENVVPQIMAAAHGGQIQNMRTGGAVPGKGVVSGDSYANDKVPAVLSPKEIVIPRSITMGENAPQRAAEFVAQVLAQSHRQKKSNFAVGGMADEIDAPSESRNPDMFNFGTSGMDLVKEQFNKPVPADDIGSLIAARDRDEQQRSQPTIGGENLGQPGPALASNNPGLGSGAPETSEPIAESAPTQDASIGGLSRAFEGMKAGQRAEANAEGELGKQEAQIIGNSQKALQEQQAKDEYFNKNIEADTEKFKQDYANGHIDPNHFVANMSTGRKILTAVGLMLSGMGSGGSGQPNLAGQFLQSQIDQDIKAQETDMGKKHNLLSINMQQYKNLKDAQAVTRANMIDMANMELKKAAALSKDPMAKARAMQESSKLELMKQQTLGPVIMKEKLLKQANANGTDPAKLVPLLVPKEHQKDVFSSIEAAENTRHLSKSILSSFEEAAKENTVMRTGGGLLRTPGSVFALHQHMQPTFKDLEGTVRQAAMDNTFKNITPMPGDSDHKVEQKRQALQEYLKAKASAPTARSFGIDLNKFASTSSDPMMQLNPQEQKWVSWAKQNPDNPKAKLALKKLGVE